MTAHFQTHFGDPCVHCGLSLDEMKPGACEGDPAKAVVTDYAVVETRWDGVEHYRYRLSTNEVREVHRHVSEHAPYYHFGRSDELTNPPRYDARLKSHRAAIRPTLAATRAEAALAQPKEAYMSDPRFLQQGYDAQAAHVVEEIGEFLADAGPLLAALGKAARWGLDSVDPTIPPEQRETNRAWVRRALSKAKIELSDVHQAIARLELTMDSEA